MLNFDNLEAKRVFEIFEEINSVPRCSKKEQKISAWLEDWAKQRGLSVEKDDAMNLVIRKKGTLGLENSKPVIIQAHMDMVCEKTKESNHDFDNDPIEMYIKDGRIYAKETTLGADNGIGLAFALAALEDDSIKHPPLEVVVTSDEETGMSGAMAFDTSNLEGKTFINVDSEEEGLFYMSCAGGNGTTLILPVNREIVVGKMLEVEAVGFLGGHSGLEIDQDRANAAKVMGRYLNILIENNIKYYIVDINGGSKSNAIAREMLAKLVIATDDIPAIEKITEELNHALKDEYTPQDPDVHLVLNIKEEDEYNAMNLESSRKVVYYLVLTPYGPTHYSKYIEGLVQTSANIGVVRSEDNEVVFESALRSSIISQKQAVIEQINVIGRVLEAEVVSTAFYPAWPYNADSKIKDIFLESYEELFNEKGEIVAIHAGLECGLFKEKMGEEVDFISFGPDITGAHTVEESLSIDSTERNWKLFKKVLSKL